MAASLVFKLHDGGPELVREVLLERGWKEYDEEQEEEDWNLYWRVSAFRTSEYHKLLPWQRLNHHPKTVRITRKDNLARSLRRMRATFGSTRYNFSPTAFILPNDYIRFLDEYTKQRLSGAYWICKPVDLSRGRGIFIFDDIKDLIYNSSVIVQRYIRDPLLISGYKFDLRIYVCVKSFHPLTVYMHQEGLVRFATEKYNLSSLDNLYAHLTNTSINKFGPFYTTNKERVGQGCKWTMSKFRYFLHSQDINELLLWQKIKNIVTLTLLAIAPSVPSSPNCVELFGFDILIDSKFKPWLLEVNYSPALTLDCQVDVAVKKRLINDLIDLMNYRSIDSLRERAFRRQSYRQPCHNASHASQVLTPVLSKCKELKSQRRSGSHSSQTQTLPLFKELCQHQSSKISQPRQNVMVSGCQKYLPPVNLSWIHAPGGSIINTNTATKTHTGQTLNPILGPHSRITTAVVNGETYPPLASYLMDNWAPNVCEVTVHDDTVTEMPSEEADVSSVIPDTPQRGLGSLRSKPAGLRKLPNIHRPLKLPLEGTRASVRETVPPLRVGDFILTFPFNRATLEASRHKLDVKLAVQELHKLTCQLASGCSESDKSKWRRQEKVKEDEGARICDSEETFESLFWGPKDPLLLSQCLSQN